MNVSVSSKRHVPRYLLLSYWALLCSGRTICDDENRGVTDRAVNFDALLCPTDGQHTNRVEGREEMKYFDFLRSLLLIKQVKINIPGKTLFLNTDCAAQQFDFHNRSANSRKCRGVI